MLKSGPKSADSGQHLGPDKPFSKHEIPGCWAEESAGRLKAIHIHYLTSSATITSSSRHFQVVLSRPGFYAAVGPARDSRPSFSFLSRRRRLQSPSIKSTSWTVHSSCEATTSQTCFLFLPLAVMIFSTGTICSRPGNRIGEQMELFTLHYLHMRGVNLKRHSPSRTRKSLFNKHGLAIDPSSHLRKWLIEWFKMKTFWLIPICLEGKD